MENLPSPSFHPLPVLKSKPSTVANRDASLSPKGKKSLLEVIFITALGSFLANIKNSRRAGKNGPLGHLIFWWHNFTPRIEDVCLPGFRAGQDS
jgi:hypothetical protein